MCIKFTVGAWQSSTSTLRLSYPSPAAKVHRAMGREVFAMMGISGTFLQAENSALRQCLEASALPEMIPACRVKRAPASMATSRVSALNNKLLRGRRTKREGAGGWKS